MSWGDWIFAQEDEIDGLYDVEFVNGVEREIHIVRVIRDMHGEPVYLYNEDDRVYPWNKVLSIKKKEAS